MSYNKTEISEAVPNELDDMPDCFGEGIDWLVEQGKDPVIKEVLSKLSGEVVDGDMSPGSNFLWKQQKHLSVISDQLMRNRTCNGRTQRQLVLPKRYWSVALKYVHDNMGHLSRDRSLQLLWERYYRVGMHRTVADYISYCGRCIRHKDWNQQRAPLMSTTSTQPMDLVCMDFLKLEPSKGGIENILVVTDHFTKYAQAYATKNQTAKTIWWYITVFQNGCIATKAVMLKVKQLRSCVSWQEFRKAGRRCTIPWEMGLQSCYIQLY